MDKPGHAKKSSDLHSDRGAELLEHFQWEDQPEITDKIADELADVMIYCLGFSDILKIDVSQALTRKLEKNRKKYPVE